MKVIISSIVFLLMAVTGISQQLHFAFLQTDTRKPFYVTLNNRNYSSTASGYIILPKLQNGDYAIRIGFAKNEETAEQEYLLQVKDNDQGYLIKDFGDKGWGLFNLQTMAVQYAGAAAQEKAKIAAAQKAEAEQRQQKLQEEAQAAETQRRNDSLKTVAAAQQQYADSIATIAAATRQRNYEDSITKLNDAARQNRYTDSIANVAAAANEAERIAKLAADSTAKAQAAATKKEQDDIAAKLENETAVARENERLEKLADSTARAQAAAIEKQREKEEAATKNENASSTATKLPDNILTKRNDTVKNIQLPILIQQAFTDTGWYYAYNVINNNQRETVQVFIPSAQPKLPVNTSATVEKEILPVNDIKKDTLPNTNSEIVTEKVDNSPVIAGTVATPSTEVKDSTPVTAEKSILNSNCKSVANEKDFLTARRKIASVFGTDAMLVAAGKIFKEKCYTTEQLRNLCVLFLTDEGRYKFLDTAYPFAFDAYRYGQLQDLLLDNYYLQRFKSMLR
jgi:hypothetical protein